MSQPEPQFQIRADDRTRGGSLSVANLNRIVKILLSGGFAVLPSDTAYSVAAIAVSGRTRTTINNWLNRADEPVLLAFPSISAVRQWITPNDDAEDLLAAFCPGPVAVVTRVAPTVPAQFFEDGLRGPNSTVGVRIPDSIVERDVAATAGYPITTVAIRGLDTGTALTSFDAALEVVTSRVDYIGGAPWCVVEGGGFYKANSSVVIIRDARPHLLKRRGDLDKARIEEVVGPVIEEQPV
jgi:L-threonylcarbamoyladenylate synthase